jgi:small-conductance mechanosensitive channel
MPTATDLVDQFARLAHPWASLYNDHPAVQTGLTFLHVAGIFLGGGFAIATDRETLMTMQAARLSGQIRHLAHLHTVHRPVLVGLVTALVSGFLLFAADVQTFARSPVFWVKMALLGLLLANGFILSRTETSLREGTPDSPALWARLSYVSAASIVLWLGLILLGTVLMNHA